MRLTVDELRLRLVSLAVWWAAVVALVAAVVAVYPSIAGQTSLDSIYANLSPAAQALLGGSSLTSPEGYLRTQLFAFFLPAVLLVFTVGRSASAVAGEEEQRTLDLLMAQPLSRTAIYLAKSGAVVVGVIVLALGSWLPLVVLDNPARLHLPVSALTAESARLALLLLVAGTWTQAIASAAGRRSVGVAVVVGYLVIAYVVDGLAASIGWLGPARPLSMWHWYAGDEPLSHGWGWPNLVVLTVAALLGLAVGVLAFRRRNTRA